MKYFLATLPTSLILMVSLITPILIIVRSRRNMRIEPGQFEVLRFRAIASLVLWLIPTTVVWSFAIFVVWVASWPGDSPEPGSLTLLDSNTATLKGYLPYAVFVLLYGVGCYLLVQLNSQRSKTA